MLVNGKENKNFDSLTSKEINIHTFNETLYGMFPVETDNDNFMYAKYTYKTTSNPA